jgi:hypothetical protein
MRIVGWLTSGLGIVGVVVSNGLASVVWLLLFEVRKRTHRLLTIPQQGLERAVELTTSVSSQLTTSSQSVGDILAKADALAKAPKVDAAAAQDLNAAIHAFVSGPYAEMRTGYATLRERAAFIGDVLQGLSGSVPFLALPSIAVERLQALDAKLVQFDASITSLSQAGAEGLAQPGVAARVAERAANVQQVLDTLAELATDIGADLNDSHDRIAATDHRITRRLTAGAAVVSGVSLFLSALNVLLFQQGRRWSRR